ncbi:hypothetical protein LTR82_010426 [Friedmanniomyces endolithicus]|uniref:Uncharacterized protein n=1 Tax=Friedmanniomyces endolithicus TaxID=329885 RepID=A0AAN6FM80_9PEZI|nr:hypothetical protein LTR82_010426 [Friedmanniomyces endolithicus]
MDSQSKTAKSAKARQSNGRTIHRSSSARSSSSSSGIHVATIPRRSPGPKVEDDAEGGEEAPASVNAASLEGSRCRVVAGHVLIIKLRPHQAALLNGNTAKVKPEDVEDDVKTNDDGNADGRNARGTFSREHTLRHPETKWVHRGQGRYLPVKKVQRDAAAVPERKTSRNGRSWRHDFPVKVKDEQLGVGGEDLPPPTSNSESIGRDARRVTEPGGPVDLSKQAPPITKKRAPRDSLTDALSGPPQYGLRRHRNSEPQPTTPFTESRSARLTRRAKFLPSIEKHTRTPLRKSFTVKSESEDEEGNMRQTDKGTYDREYVEAHPEEVFHQTGNGWFKKGPHPTRKSHVVTSHGSKRLTSKVPRKASRPLSANASVHRDDLPKYPGMEFTHQGNGWFRPGPDPRGRRSSMLVPGTSDEGQCDDDEAGEDDGEAEENEEDEEEEEEELSEGEDDDREGKKGVKATVSRAYKDAHPGIAWVHRGNGRWARRSRVSTAPTVRSTELSASERRNSDTTYSKAHIEAHPDEEFYHTGNARWKRGSRPSNKSAPPVSVAESEVEDDEPYALFDRAHVQAHPHQVFHHRGQGRFARGPRPAATPAREPKIEPKEEGEDEKEDGLVDGIDRAQLVDSSFVDSHPNTTFYHKGQGRWAFGMPPPGSHNKIAVRGPGAKERTTSKEQEEMGPPMTALFVKTEGPDMFPTLEWHYRGGGKWGRITKQEADYTKAKPFGGQRAAGFSKAAAKKPRRFTINEEDDDQDGERPKIKRGRKSQQGLEGVNSNGSGSNGVSKSRSQKPKVKARMLEPHEDILDDADLPSIFGREWAAPVGVQDPVDTLLRATYPALNTSKVLASLTKFDPAVRPTGVLHTLAANAQRALDDLQKEYMALDKVTAQHAKIPRKPAKGGRLPADPHLFDDKKEADLYDYQFDPRKIGFQDPTTQRIVRDAEGRELRKRRNRSGVETTDTVPGWRFGEEGLDAKRASRQPMRFDGNPGVERQPALKRMKIAGGGVDGGVFGSETPERGGTPADGAAVAAGAGGSLRGAGIGRGGNVPKRIQQLRGESVVSVRSGSDGGGLGAGARKGRPPGSKNLMRRKDAGIPKGPRRKRVVPEDGGEGVEVGEWDFEM